MRDNKKKPYAGFGSKVKLLRQKKQETLNDISGAVEADIKLLNKIEAGEIQPTEELVLLLISHFSLKEKDAHNLWKLAGYGKLFEGRAELDNADVQHAYDLFNPEDGKIVYTDLVNVSANKYGVVINFLQGLGLKDNGVPMAVARIGMSLDHAKSVIDVLAKSIEMVEADNKIKPSLKEDRKKTIS